MPVEPGRAPLADRPAGHSTALLIVDMISAWDFPDAEKLATGAAEIAPRIAVLKRRCLGHSVPAIYVNDNRGRWRSDFRELAAMTAASTPTGAEIARHLAPAKADYSVLKPKHSAFYATPLDLLLRHLKVERVIVTGVTTDMCIAMTAAEARMRDYEVTVPRDCVASLSAARTARSLQALEETNGVTTTMSTRLRFPSSGGRAASRGTRAA